MKLFSFAEITGRDGEPSDGGEAERLKRDCSEQRHADGNVLFAVVGHSMGGCALTFLGDCFARDYGQKFLGCIFLAPAIVGPIPDKVTCFALNILSRIVPFLPVGPPEHTEQYDTGSGWDLNYGGRMRLSTAAMFVKLFSEVRGSMDRMTAPDDDRFALASLEDPKYLCTMRTYSWLVLHGDKDGVVPLSQATRIYDFFRSPVDSNLSKEVVVMKGVGHTPFCDEGSEEMKQSINSYIDKAVEWTQARLQVALHKDAES
jgi:pimeloyl-ACP methyl ester carboxylesterase